MRFAVAGVLALLVGVTSAQDDARVADLVKKLGDGEYAVREKAKTELAAIGAPALKALEAELNNRDPEIAQSARDLVEKIKRSQVVQGVIKAGTKITVKSEGTLEDAVKAVGTASGLQIRVPDNLKTVAVAIDVQDAELLKVLDSIARQIKDATWRFDGMTSVVFSDGKFIDYPAAYKGPFKFTVTRSNVSTENDFLKKRSNIELTINTEWEPGSKPSDYSLRIVETVDADGKKHAPETQVADEGMGGGQQGMSVMSVNGKTIKVINDNGKMRVVTEDGADSPEGKSVSLRDAAAAKFQTIRCRATFTVATQAKTEVKFEHPAAGASQMAGDIEVVIEDIDEDEIVVALKGKNGEPIRADLLDKDSMVLVSGGKEIEAEVGREEGFQQGWDGKNVQKLVRRAQRAQNGAASNGARFTVTVPRKARGQAIDALKFSVRQVVNHQVEFEFKDLDLR